MNYNCCHIATDSVNTKLSAPCTTGSGPARLLVYWPGGEQFAPYLSFLVPDIPNMPMRATLLSRGQLRLFSSYRGARIISLPRNPPFSKLEAVTMSGSASSGESGDDSNPSASQQARAGMKANQTGTGWIPSTLRRFFSQPAEGRPKRSTCLNEK